MIYPKNPQTDTQVFFTITANDNGNENVNINLYIDGQTAETSTGHGVHTYQGGPYSPGTHTYLVTATDQANNKASDPTSGYYVFVITDPNAKTTSESTTSLWIVLAVFASLSAITLTFTALRKNKKTPATTQPNQ
jgi:hypothetical protein